MHWLTWLVTLAMVGFILTQYGAPFLVRRFSSNVRIRSIGLRSARGVFVKFGTFTYTAERIALVIHRPPGGLRIGVEVQNVVITLAKATKIVKPKKAASTLWRGVRDHHSRSMSMSSVVDDTLALKDSKTRHAESRTTIQWLVECSQSLFRILSVLALRLFVRLLPALTQSSDIYCDYVTIVSEELEGAHVVVKGARLAVLAEFTQQDQESLEAEGDKPSGELERLMKFRLGWSKKWKDSMERIWEKATARTNGFASVSVDLQELAAYSTSPEKAMLSSYNSARFDQHGIDLSQSTAVEKDMPSESLLFIQGPVKLQSSVRFNPQRYVFIRHSGELVLQLPKVELAADQVAALLDRLLPEEQDASATYASNHSPASSTSSSPSTAWAPMMGAFSPTMSPKIQPQKSTSVSGLIHGLHRMTDTDLLEMALQLALQAKTEKNITPGKHHAYTRSFCLPKILGPLCRLKRR